MHVWSNLWRHCNHSPPTAPALLLSHSHSSILYISPPSPLHSPLPFPTPPPHPHIHTHTPTSLSSRPHTCCLCGRGAYGSPRSKHGGGKGVQQRAALHCGIQGVSMRGKRRRGWIVSVTLALIAAVTSSIDTEQQGGWHDHTKTSDWTIA